IQQEFSGEYGDMPPEEERPATALRNAAFLIAGLVVIVWGADLLVDGAVEIARMLTKITMLRAGFTTGCIVRLWLPANHISRSALRCSPAQRSGRATVSRWH